jgi:4-amino-4-deoxy-L-arabinose transferase-like glycosyltransferase
MPLTAPTSRTWPWRLAAASLILGSVVLRLVYLAHNCPLDLAPDEAHYWDWSRHLDWSYYSKGPLVAYLIRLGCVLFGPWSQQLIGSEMLAVRLPAVACGGLLLAGLYTLTVQVYCSDRLALAVVAIALTLPVLNAGASLMTIDAPFCFLWCWALVFGYRALFGPGSWAWLATGLCIALGVLTKHTMVLFVPCVGLFLLATPVLRPLLWSRRFWAMTGLGALGGVPILAWNAMHGWVTLKHEQLHIGLDEGPAIHWLGPLRYLALQFLVLLGFWFVAWARAMWAQRPGRAAHPQVGYLWWMSLPPIVFFGCFSFKNGGGEPNWPIVGYLSGLVLTADWLSGELRHPSASYRRASWAATAFFCVLGLLLTALVHNSHWLQPVLARWSPPGDGTLRRRLDPTCRLRGWRVLADGVDRLRQRVEQEEGEPPVLAASWWIVPGELGFYCNGHPTVHSVGLPLGDRHSQYDLWHPNPTAAEDFQAFAGKTFIVVGVGEDRLRDAFDRVEPAQIIVCAESGQEIQRWAVTVAHGYRGFPPPAPNLVH